VAGQVQAVLAVVGGIDDVAFLDEPLAKVGGGFPLILDDQKPLWLLACYGKSDLASGSLPHGLE